MRALLCPAILLAVSAAFVLPACLADADAPADLALREPAVVAPHGAQDGIPAPGFDDARGELDAPAADQPAEYCKYLPADGPCALACDPEVLIERFVPIGTCMILECQLTNGEPLNVGGCNN